jgi:asparagine synthase (glutamine-hydrolysing)
MCGLAGLILAPPKIVEQQVIATFLDALKHRGPDDLGWLALSNSNVHIGREIRGDIDAQAVLIHRRLSILDLSEAGWQPMATSDGRYYVVFNGEIYNYVELQAELEGLGHRFSSRSDTEVLLVAYSQWGLEALERLVGMFAVAILDTHTRTMLLARDFFGIKPLYYTYWRDGFAFASEIESLLALPGVGRRVNPERLYDYLRFGLSDHGQETLFAGIYQLPSAHYMEVSLDNPATTAAVPYWQIDLEQKIDLSFEEAARCVRDIFLESIDLHLRSDVPVGAALSGGIDSSSIVMAMRYLRGSEVDLHTFSYVAADSQLSEERWIDQVVKTSDAVSHKIQPRPDDLIHDLGHLIQIQGEPVASTSIYAQQRVFQAAREAGIKVMLDGQGADELFGGYTYCAAARFASLTRQGKWINSARFLRAASRTGEPSMLWLFARSADFLLPPELQAVVRRLVGRELVPRWMNAGWFSKRDVVPHSPHYIRGKEILKQSLHHILSEASLPHLLRYEDRNSMSFSIESRVPFLTPKLASFVFSLPEEFLIAPDGTSKAIFRSAMRGIVPQPILDRRDKIGFATPEQMWLTTLRPWVDHTLSNGTGDIHALNMQEVRRDWEAVLQGRRRFDSRVWRWINLIEWSHRFDVCFE